MARTSRFLGQPDQSSRGAALLAAAPLLLISAVANALAWRTDARWFEQHVLMYCFFVTPRVLWWSTHLRPALLGVGAGALACASLVGLLSRRKTMRGGCAGWLRVTVPVPPAVATCELLMRRP